MQSLWLCVCKKRYNSEVFSIGLFNKQFRAIKETFKSEWPRMSTDNVYHKGSWRSSCTSELWWKYMSWMWKKFTLKSNLKQHVRVIHNSSETFKCDKCTKVFRHKSSLNKHIKNCKSNTKQWKLVLILIISI